MQTIIAIALHRESPLPSDSLYRPVQAGAALHPRLDATPDCTGDHISERNPLYCELTAHYWMWKNLRADAYGLCHYRRYFSAHLTGHSVSQALTARQAERLLQGADVIVPRPRVYLIETNYSHYAHAHNASDLDTARDVIAQRCPDYLPAFDRVMKRRWGRRFNMFIMRKEPFEAYSAWLFDILFEVERRLGASAQERSLGHAAERLMDVWLAAQPDLRLKHVRVLHTEGQHWPRRIAAFLRRKVTGAPAKVPAGKTHRK